MNIQTPPEQYDRRKAFHRRHRTGLVKLVFTDLVNAAALRQQLSDQAGTSLFQTHRQLLCQTLARPTDAGDIVTAAEDNDAPLSS